MKLTNRINFLKSTKAKNTFNNSSEVISNNYQMLLHTIIDHKYQFWINFRYKIMEIKAKLRKIRIKSFLFKQLNQILLLKKAPRILILSQIEIQQITKTNCLQGHRFPYHKQLYQRNPQFNNLTLPFLSRHLHHLKFNYNCKSLHKIKQYRK